MKAIVLACFVTISTAIAQDAPAPLTVELRTGEKLSVTKISRVEPDGITVWTDAGPKKLAVAKLAKAEMEKYGLTEEAAAAHAVARQKAEARARHQESAMNQQDPFCEAPTAPAREKNELEAWIGPGHQMAMDSYLAKFGPRFQHSGTFKEGPMKGKTLDQAIAQFEQTWASTPASVRLNWAKRAMMAGQTPELQAAAADARASEEEARRQRAEDERQRLQDAERERRLQTLEKAEEDRLNRERSPWGK